MFLIVAIIISFFLLACGPDAQEPSQQTGFEPLAALSSYEGNQPPGIVTLAWDTVDDATVQGYRLHLGIDSGHYIAHGKVGNSTSFTLHLPRGFTWHFAITAYNAAGESPYSEEVFTSLPLL
ncbi:MAG: fibronectin type III domain-containing protein [Nitrospirae bacterium]|nr:fibronectin type III domain-containing protein [Nitrospirota bacterium]